MPDFPFPEMTVARAHRAMAGGSLTCEALVRAYLARIEALDRLAPPLNAVVQTNPGALDEARRLDAAFAKGGLTGPLHGIPVLLKDNVETADMPTTAGSKSLAGWRTGRDAFLTRRLRAAGAVILAKTNLHEFAIWGETISSILGQSRNPYDLTRTPGGSSGGTGAGIAANFGLVGIGTDTVNSIRSPASACCLCGLRPTVGLVSRAGIVPYSLTQDTAGPITRTVEDAARVLGTIAGYDEADEATRAGVRHVPKSYLAFLDADGLTGRRLGLVGGFVGHEEINRPVNKALAGSFALLRAQGAEIVELNAPFDSAALVRDVSVHLHDLRDHLEAYLASFGGTAPFHTVEELLAGGQYTPGVEENLRAAARLHASGPEYERRLQKRGVLQTQLVALMDEYRLDALVYPHQQQLVCKTGESQQQRNGVLASVTGLPAFTVPGGFSAPDENAPLGVPVGIEFLGRPFDEGRLLSIAYAFEQANPVRRPPHFPPG